MEFLFTDTKNDVYILPSSKDGLCIYYSPLRNTSCYLSTNLIPDLIRFYTHGEKSSNADLNEILQELESIPFVPETRLVGNINLQDRLIILPTQKCNLACSYCFAQEARSNEILSFQKIKTAVDYIFSQKNGRKKGVGFLGGGEPLICWDTLVKTCEYVKKIGEQTDTQFEFGVTTNGTLIDEQKVSYLAENNFFVIISTEIIPEVQDKQRPFAFRKGHSSEAVYNAIKLLNDYGVRFRIRATITEDCVSLMPLMVNYIVKEAPFVKQISFEPVTDSTVDYDTYYNNYRLKFMEALKEGRKHNIKIVNSMVLSLYHVKNNFCSGELCLTPNGEITSCHRHSSSQDRFYNYCQYGNVDDSLKIDINKIQRIQDIRREGQELCDNCFAIKHCAGGCTSQKLVFSKSQRLAFCNYAQSLLRDLLEFNMEEKDIDLTLNSRAETC